MPITVIHSFLVSPGKNSEEQPDIGGARIAPSKVGRLTQMLEGIYSDADDQCKIDISFNHQADGTQQNDCRDLLVTFAEGGKLADGRALAQRLQSVTTNKSGLGLLFLILGSEPTGETKAVLSRFPADHGILADQKKGELSVEFLERVFMKKANSYKAATYRARNVASGFWEGKAIDRQINTGSITISDYWIKDFLASDFRTTSAAGSRRLGEALREATNKAPSLAVKSELIAATQLARGLSKKSTSITEFLGKFALSAEARNLVARQVPEHLRDEQFKLDVEELDRHFPMRSVELDNGGLMIADTSKFDKVFARQALGDDGRVRFATEGRVVNEKLRKSR